MLLLLVGEVVVGRIIVELLLRLLLLRRGLGSLLLVLLELLLLVGTDLDLVAIDLDVLQPAVHERLLARLQRTQLFHLQSVLGEVAALRGIPALHAHRVDNIPRLVVLVHADAHERRLVVRLLQTRVLLHRQHLCRHQHVAAAAAHANLRPRVPRQTLRVEQFDHRHQRLRHRPEKRLDRGGRFAHAQRRRLLLTSNVARHLLNLSAFKLKFFLFS